VKKLDPVAEIEEFIDGQYKVARDLLADITKAIAPRGLGELPVSEEEHQFDLENATVDYWIRMIGREAQAAPLYGENLGDALLNVLTFDREMRERNGSGI
jgi:hypothetical protein